MITSMHQSSCDYSTETDIQMDGQMPDCYTDPALLQAGNIKFNNRKISSTTGIIMTTCRQTNYELLR